MQHLPPLRKESPSTGLSPCCGKEVALLAPVQPRRPVISSSEPVTGRGTTANACAGPMSMNGEGSMERTSIYCFMSHRVLIANFAPCHCVGPRPSFRRDTSQVLQIPNLLLVEMPRTMYPGICIGTRSEHGFTTCSKRLRPTLKVKSALSAGATQAGAKPAGSSESVWVFGSIVGLFRSTIERLSHRARFLHSDRGVLSARPQKKENLVGTTRNPVIPGYSHGCRNDKADNLVVVNDRALFRQGQPSAASVLRRLSAVQRLPVALRKSSSLSLCAMSGLRMPAALSSSARARAAATRADLPSVHAV